MMNRRCALAVAAFLALGAMGCNAEREVVVGSDPSSEQVDDSEEVSNDEEAAPEQARLAEVSADRLSVAVAWLPEGYEYHSETRQDHGSTGGIVMQRYVGPPLSDTYIDDLPPGPVAQGAREQLHVALTNVVPGETTWSFEYAPAEELGSARELTVGGSEAWIMELGDTVKTTRLEFLVEPGLLVQVTSLHLGEDELVEIAEGISVDEPSEGEGS